MNKNFNSRECWREFWLKPNWAIELVRKHQRNDFDFCSWLWFWVTLNWKTTHGPYFSQMNKNLSPAGGLFKTLDQYDFNSSTQKKMFTWKEIRLSYEYIIKTMGIFIPKWKIFAISVHCFWRTVSICNNFYCKNIRN